MGNQASVEAYVREEFERVGYQEERERYNGEKWVHLGQLLEIKPLRDWTLDFGHLGTLWVLDREKTGVFLLSDFLSFATFAHKRGASHRAHEFQGHIQACCTLELYNAVTHPVGMKQFVTWFTSLLTACADVLTFDDQPTEQFISHDPLMFCYRIFQIEVMYGMHYQDFFDLLQRVGEEKGLLHLDAEHLDDVVPVSVMRDFAESLMEGFVSMMNDLDFETGIKVG
eukprot:TRINITY_DN4319_c0_g1_i2.p1 TRINITY_DN4319_c0_g1~~TRINITY_DN4319_c0_g1_i2.p1  ORF type:complete len:226 (+),score=17.07 TRINITY_DN4319_c0_g1_i2:130-807(+)